jgi:hypothetical protein
MLFHKKAVPLQAIISAIIITKINLKKIAYEKVFSFGH